MGHILKPCLEDYLKNALESPVLIRNNELYIQSVSI